MVENLIIIGAGGSSRQIAEAVESINAQRRRWSLLGFLDDTTQLQGTQVGGLPVLGPVKDAARYRSRFIIGIASVRNLGARQKLVEALKLRSDRYATIIHPSAHISRHARIGFGSAVLQNAVITHDSNIGDHVIVLHTVSIGHNVQIEDFATIAPGAVITGYSRVKRNCYVGAGSTINNARVVHEGSVVGLGSVVVKDVPPDTTVIGNPAVATKSKRRIEAAE